MKSVFFKISLSLAITSSLMAFSEDRAVATTSAPITLAESQLYVAPDTAVHSLNQTINLKKGHDKLQLNLAKCHFCLSNFSWRW